MIGVSARKRRTDGERHLRIRRSWEASAVALAFEASDFAADDGVE